MYLLLVGADAYIGPWDRFRDWIMKKTLNRKKLRHTDYDYSDYGTYFITICTNNREKILSNVIGYDRGSELTVREDRFIEPYVELTELGKIVDECIKHIPGIDRYVIMPNHIHMILIKTPDDPKTNLSSDIRSFKTIVTKRAGRQIWQRSFHDHILRDGEELQRYYTYLSDNPALWALDEYYTEECA